MYVFSVKHSKDNSSITRHEHNYDQLIFIREGQISATVDGKKVILGAGDILLLSKFKAHDIEVISDVYERYVLCISVAGNGSGIVADQFANIIFNRTVSCAEYQGRIEALLTSMMEEENAFPLHKQLLDLKLQELFILLYRVDPTLFPNFAHPNAKAIEQIRRRFETDYAKDYKIEDLAAEFNFSTSYLSHLFKQFTGCSPIAYLLSCRLMASCNMLSSTDDTVNEIVHRCNLGDASNFCRMFKKKMGMTPLEYRTRERSGQK